MALTHTKTETMNVTEARRTFSETLDRVRRGETRVIVEKSGIPVGAVVSMADLARIRSVDADRARLFETMSRISAGFSDLSEDEVETLVDDAIAEVHSTRRQRFGVAQRKAS